MTDIILPGSVPPILPAAHQAELTHWLVAPTTIECGTCAIDRVTREQCPTCVWGVVLGVDDEMLCPDCGGACFVEVLGAVPAHLTGDCPQCAATGRLPWVVNVGDRVTVPISDELPDTPDFFQMVVDHGQPTGEGHPLGADRCVECRAPWPCPSYLLGKQGEGLTLHPGGSLSGTVAAIPDTTKAALPIVAYDGDTPDAPHDAPHICVTTLGTFLHDGNWPVKDLTAELVWQDFTPGMQAFRLTDVTVTP